MKVDLLSCQHCGEPVEPGAEAVDAEGMTTEYHPGKCAFEHGIFTEDQAELVRYLYEVQRDRNGCCGPDQWVRQQYERMPRKRK